MGKTVVVKIINALDGWIQGKIPIYIRLPTLPFEHTICPWPRPTALKRTGPPSSEQDSIVRLSKISTHA